MQSYTKIYYKSIFPFIIRRFFFLLLLLATTSSAWAQIKTVYIDDNKLTIKQALEKIGQQTGYMFVFSNTDVDLSKRIELPGTSTGLTEMLDLVFADTGYDYRIYGKNIAIIKTGNAPKQSKTPIAGEILATQNISGVVIDEESGRPLMGAVASVSGMPKKTAVSDHAGMFTINGITVGDHRIRTSHKGFYLSERGVTVAASIPAEVKIILIPTTSNLGSIRSDADNGGIVTAETSSDAVELIASMTSTSDTTVVEIPIVTTSESTIISPYLHGVDPRQAKVGIKTNLLYLATMSPNVGVEWRMAPKWSAEVTAGFGMFKYGDIFRKGDDAVLNHWLVKPEIRYWFCRAFDGHFFGVHGLAGQFNTSELPFKMPWKFDQGFADNTNYVGWTYGGGLTYGYQWAVSNRWNIEASIGVGYVRFDYDTYDMYEECMSCRYNKTRHYFGPTKAGVSLIYIIK